MRSVQKQPIEGQTAGKRYRIGHLLRRAASGDVYACSDLIEGDSSLAIRIPHVSEFHENPEDLSRRMVMLKKLRHPRIESIFDFGILPGTHGLFLVSGNAEGSDFYSGTETGNLSIILTLFAEILRVLRYPHSRGLFHGNLTPESVLLLKNSDGCSFPLLRDFSLSHRVCRIGGFFPDRESICYAAPELLLEGRNSKETDFYALGVLLYQSLTRRLPFENGDPDFLIQKLIQGNIDLGPVECMEGGPGIIPLLERLLEKDPAKRIRSVEEALVLLPPQFRRDFDLSAEKAGRFSAAPFVGREKEMRLLRKRAGRVKESGRGWTVFIAGEAGSGKTRCMEELRGWALVNGWRVAEGVCSSREESPYAPYRQIIGKKGFSEKELLSFSEDISLAAESDFSSSEFTAERLQDRLTRELIRRLSGRPTLLLLHDIHWASMEACTVLEYLCSDIRAYPVFVCASFSTGEISEEVVRRVVNGARRGERGEVVSLDPLTKDDVRQMIAGLTGGDEYQKGFCSWMFRAVGGNPLFLEEMLEHLAKHGILRNHPDGWKFVTSLPTRPEVPDGVGMVVKKLLSRLSPTALEALEWLSLFQQAVPRKYAQLLTAYDCKTAEASLAELVRCRLLCVESSTGEETLAPSHEIIAEVTRGMIPHERKQKMYREIAELLEKEAGKDHLYEAALHYIESPPDDHSVHCALAAVTSFQAVFAHENAMRCFEYVFKYKNRLTTKELFQAIIAVCDSMFALGKARKAVRLIHSMFRSRPDVEPEMKARLYLHMAMAYRHIDDWRSHERNCHAGLRTLRKFSDDERFTKTLLLVELAFGAAMRSCVRNALRYLDLAMEACPDRNSPDLISRIQNLYAILHCIAGEYKKAADAGEKAIAILKHSRENIQKCAALSTLGLAHMKRGRFAAALKLHLRTAALSEKSRSAVPRGHAVGNLAECLYRMGRIRESFAAMAHASATAKESGDPAMRRACDAVAAGINLAACDYRETRRLLKPLESDEQQTVYAFTAGLAGYVSAELNFRLGDFANALDDIGKLSKMNTAEAPLYEYELAKALRERILFERKEDAGALRRLLMLENRVARKRWPYQRCIIKLHICEVLIRLKRPEEAESQARNALRLAERMRSASLLCRAQLMMGINLSPLQRAFTRNAPAFTDIGDADKAIHSLNTCVKLTDLSCSLEYRWRALAELSFIYRFFRNYELCFRYAKLAYEALVKLEERTPSDMLGSFHGAFSRGRIKLELARLIEAERPLLHNSHTVESSKNTGILLRMTAMVNSVRDLHPLLDGLLELALQAIAVRRGLIFLWNDTACKLEQAGRRNTESRREVITDDVSLAVPESVFKDGKPLVSADASRDPRIIKKGIPDPPGKMLCIPLKTPERAIGVFYADCPGPVDNIGETEIDLAEAFCNLAALAVDNILARRKLTPAGEKNDSPKTPDPFPEIIGASPVTRLLKERIRLVAASPLDVLITGESGSGKELVARAIGCGGRGWNGKFISVDCGALADGVAEAELFGCRRGAFTGAAEDRAGLFEAAAGGVLFLDEISNMPLRMQAKFLRVLQEREVRRIGETLPRKIEIRVVAATNKDLTEEIKNGHFRYDLFHRLKGMEIHTPSLRERTEDIPLLVKHFLQKICDHEKGATRRFSPEATELLQQYSYPGNIRELKNIVAAAYYTSSGNVIEAGALPSEVRIRNAAEITLNSVADNLYRGILAGEGGFEDLVKKPYLSRCFEASVVRGVIQRALSDSSGVYRNAFERLRIPKNHYAATMQFLKRHRCYLDFLPFRRDCE